MKIDTLYINECFYSIQGEGVCVGLPTIFLRTTGCNFNCVWQVNGKEQHCDTQYAKEKGTKKTIVKVVKDITTLKNKYQNINMITITGGEPTLQAIPLMKLINILREIGFKHIDIESNASLPKKYKDIAYWQSHFNHYIVSPKPQTKIENLIILYKTSNKNNFYLKFVYDDSPYTLEWIEQTIKILHDIIPINHDHIILMSAGTSYEELHERDKRTIEICKRYGWRFSPRVHSYIWGLKKGV